MSTAKTSMKIDQSTRQTLKGMVRRNQTYSEVVKQRIKCDADGCDAAGTNEIKVNAGKFGIVTLFVCPNCVGKFVDNNDIKSKGIEPQKAQHLIPSTEPIPNRRTGRQSKIGNQEAYQHSS